jgi:hypothetical protein
MKTKWNNCAVCDCFWHESKKVELEILVKGFQYFVVIAQEKWMAFIFRTKGIRKKKKKFVYLQSTTNFLSHKCSIVEKWGSFSFFCKKNRPMFFLLFLVIGILFVCSYCSSRLYLGFAKVCMDLLQYQSLNARNLHIFSLRPYSSSRFIFQSHTWCTSNSKINTLHLVWHFYNCF